MLLLVLLIFLYSAYEKLTTRMASVFPKAESFHGTPPTSFPAVCRGIIIIEISLLFIFIKYYTIIL